MLKNLKAKIGIFFKSIGKGILKILEAAIVTAFKKNQQITQLDQDITLADTNKALDMVEAELNETLETQDLNIKKVDALEDLQEKVDEKRETLDKKQGVSVDTLEEEWKKQ